MTEIDFYELLEVRAHRRRQDRSRRRTGGWRCSYHPDQATLAMHEAETRFKAISEAYDCLKDPQKRAAYDRYGKAGVQGGGAGPQGVRRLLSDIFEDIFGQFTGRGRQPSGRGQDPALRPRDDL